jgi:hypothetical protein
MSVEMLKAVEAVERVRSCTLAGGQVLGIDGFQIVPDGHVGRLDLILDLSRQPMTVKAAEMGALQFIAAHEADDVMFEVVAARPLGS